MRANLVPPGCFGGLGGELPLGLCPPIFSQSEGSDSDGALQTRKLLGTYLDLGIGKYLP